MSQAASITKVRMTRCVPRSQAMVDLKKDANGTVEDFRTVDGKVGVVVELGDGSTSWFEDEIAAA